jgi:hypothetical protein
MIQQAFGHHNIDLYCDVLQVDRSASPKEIRIAYFRRGREVLAQAAAGAVELTPMAATTTTNSTRLRQATPISERAKLQFQAVSLAYEILSTPAWKRYYDRYGFTNQPTSVTSSTMPLSLSNPPLQVDEESTPPPPARVVHQHNVEPSQQSTPQRSKSVTPVSSSAQRNKKKRSSPSSLSSKSPRRRSHSVGVRWHDHVEELIYCPEDEDDDDDADDESEKGNDELLNDSTDQDDADDDDEDNKPPPKKKKRNSKRKSKKRVLVDTAEDNLSIHLRKLDQEAGGGGFMTELLDTLEASFDEFMQLDNNGVGDHDDDDEDDGEDDGEDDDDLLIIEPEKLHDDDDNEDEVGLRKRPIPKPMMEEEEEDDSSGGDVEVVAEISQSLLALNNMTSTTVGNFVTDLLDHVSARFDQLMSYDEDDKDEATAELAPAEERTSTYSPSFFNNLVAVAPKRRSAPQGNANQLVIGPVAQWGLPEGQDPVATTATTPAPTVRRATVSSSELVAGPVAEWGRVTIPSANQGYYSTPGPRQDQTRNATFVKMKPPSFPSPPEPEPSLPDDESSAPPPIKEVLKVHLPHHARAGEDDMSSISESYASHRLTDPRAWIALPTTTVGRNRLPFHPPPGIPEVRSMESSPSLGMAPSRHHVEDAFAYNPSNPFNEDAESIVYKTDERRNDSPHNNSTVVVSTGHHRQNSSLRITVHENNQDDDHCMGCISEDGFGAICCGETVGMSTISKATRTTGGSTTSSFNSSRRDKSSGALDFFLYLVTYLEEISSDLLECSSNAGRTSAKAMLNAVLITDEDLEGMMQILKCEMDKHHV